MGDDFVRLETGRAVRVCLPAELPAASIAALAESAATELEVQVFGRLPLAISARCYHARSRGLAKDGCRFVCGEDADGMPVATLDDEPIFAVNGLQTLSAAYCSLLAELAELQRMGVGLFRLWPQSRDMAAVASQANIGGGSTALATARSIGRPELGLPAILVGSLGTALGTYLGFLTVLWLA